METTIAQAKRWRLLPSAEMNCWYCFEISERSNPNPFTFSTALDWLGRFVKRGEKGIMKPLTIRALLHDAGGEQPGISHITRLKTGKDSLQNQVGG